MALSQNTYVYMETMEIAQNKEEESYKNGNPWILCEHGGKLSKGTLVLCQSNDSQESHDKRKTDKQWLLWFSRSLSVCARQLLKPPCTERYARWCERTAVSHRLLLDYRKFLKSSEIVYNKLEIKNDMTKERMVNSEVFRFVHFRKNTKDNIAYRME